MGRDQLNLDIRHSLDLLAHKHRVSLNAAVVSDRYLSGSEGNATKAWTNVLLLLKDHPVDIVEAAIAHAMALGTDDPAAIALLVRQRVRPTNEKLFPAVVRNMSNHVDLQAYSIAKEKRRQRLEARLLGACHDRES